MKQVSLLILIAIAAIFLFQATQLAWRVHQGFRFASSSSPFQATTNPDPQARILVVGDSTGVGTGAAHARDSVAGRLHEDYPCIAVINRSVNGARAEDVLQQLHAESGRDFDIVLLQVGGNDILRFTALDHLEVVIDRVLEEAGRHGRHVLFLSTGNVGLAPAFFPPITWVYSARTGKVRTLLMDAAVRAGVEYVDLFKERKEDPFLRDPRFYYAADYLHPGSEGYRLWYEELLRQTSIESILQATAEK